MHQLVSDWPQSFFLLFRIFSVKITQFLMHVDVGTDSALPRSAKKSAKRGSTARNAVRASFEMG